MNNKLGTIEGLYFVTFSEEGEMEYQGRILSKMQDNIYLVQIYEWLMGMESCMKILHLQTFLDAELYHTLEELKGAIQERNSI